MLKNLTHCKKKKNVNSARELHSDEKHEFIAFHYLRSERKKHVGPMNSNSLFFITKRLKTAF